MPDTFEFRTGDIPRERLEEPTNFIANYSTVLIYENQPFASGTFVKYRSHFGILMAYHVPYNTDKPFDFEINSPDQLGLAITKHAHAFWIEMQYLKPYRIGVPIDEKSGPDIAFLEILDSNKLGLIKAYRSFWDVSFENGPNMVKKCSLDSGVLWAIAGLPQSMTQAKQPEAGFSYMWGLPVQIYFGAIERWFETCGFDYIELVANYSSKDPMPDSFKGISGGGLWKIPMSIDKDKKDLNDLKFGEPVLAGLQFYQTNLKNNFRRLGCHGPKSLYSVLTKVLKDDNQK